MSRRPGTGQGPQEEGFGSQDDTTKSGQEDSSQERSQDQEDVGDEEKEDSTTEV